MKMLDANDIQPEKRVILPQPTMRGQVRIGKNEMNQSLKVQENGISLRSPMAYTSLHSPIMLCHTLGTRQYCHHDRDAPLNSSQAVDSEIRSQ